MPRAPARRRPAVVLFGVLVGLGALAQAGRTPASRRAPTPPPAAVPLGCPWPASGAPPAAAALALEGATGGARLVGTDADSLRLTVETHRGRATLRTRDGAAWRLRWDGGQCTLEAGG